MLVIQKCITIFVVSIRHRKNKLITTMKNSITYYQETLKMIEVIDGKKTQTTFKTLKELLEDKELTDEYISENPSTKMITILK